MVNSLSSTNVIQNNPITENCQKENLGKLVKYVNNEALKEVPDSFSYDIKGSLSFAGIIEGIPLIKLMHRNKKNFNKFISNNMKSIDNITKETLKNISNGTGSFWKKAINFVKTSNKAKEAYAIEKTSAKAIRIKKSLEATKVAKNTAEETVKNAKYFKLFKKRNFNKLTKKVEELATKFEKYKTAPKKALEARKAIGVIEKTAKNIKFIDKLKSGLKKPGVGWFLLNLGMEGYTEIIPTFKELGVKKGLKQLAKSTIKAAGDAFGFIAGESIGTALGTAIGTALFPGVGTVIGAVCGFITAGIGSFLMGKITGKIAGKSEREKAQEENEKQTVEQIANNQSAQTELIEAAKVKIQEEAALNGGELSEDSQLALEAINKLNQTNPFTATV